MRIIVTSKCFGRKKQFSSVDCAYLSKVVAWLLALRLYRASMHSVYRRKRGDGQKKHYNTVTPLTLNIVVSICCCVGVIILAYKVYSELDLT